MNNFHLKVVPRRVRQGLHKEIIPNRGSVNDISV
jgi:hypothetical protein